MVGIRKMVAMEAERNEVRRRRARLLGKSCSVQDEQEGAAGAAIDHD